MMTRFAKKLYSGVVKAEQFLSRSFLLTLIVLTFIAAMSRVFNFPLAWSLDLSLLLFGWFAFLAASQATRRKSNLGVNILTRHLPEKAQEIIRLINNVLILGFLGFIEYNSISLIVKNSKRLITSLGISYSFITLALSVGCFLMMISVVIQICEQIGYLTGKLSLSEITSEDTAAEA